MTVAPEHRPFEALPTAVMVISGRAVVYVNAACERLLAHSHERLLNMDVPAMIAAWAVPEEQAWLQDLSAANVAGEPLPETLWALIDTGTGPRRSVEVTWCEGPRANERCCVLVDRGGDVQRLTDALTGASWSMVAQRDDQGVLEVAADALQAQGFRVVIFGVEGDQFRHLVLRQDPAARARVEAQAGAPMKNLPLSREQAREFSEVLERRRALFIQDTHVLVDRFREPAVAALIKAAMPRRGVVAPILVDGQPFGVLAAQHEQLTPTGGAAIELFAHRVGSALENVRNHRLAAERLSELQALQNRLLLQERLATLGEAAAVLAHEVRNPVAAILNALAMLRRDPSAHTALQMAEEEALRLERLVNDLLHLARPLEPRHQSFDLASLAARAVEAAQARLGTSQITFELVAAEPVLGLGDAFLLGLALENLLTNAVRASPPSGRVRVSVATGPLGALLAVEDQGPGIGPELAERIFEPFFTTHATGTGLGLAVVRKVVDAHQGQVRAAASALGGARFEVEIPRG